MNELEQALLALVPVDGSSIGNQSLLERLKRQFQQLSEEAFWAARDGLIEQGVLHKGRGRGGSVLRAQPVASSLADQVLSKARERFEPAAVEEVSAVYVADAAASVSKGKAAKVQPATGIEDMKKTLWATADKLRANMDAAEYKHIVLGLIFLKYISDSFAGRRAELERKLTDENDDYYLGDDDPEALNAELEDRDYYREVNVFWVPEVARWESIRAAAKQVDIGKRIDDALAAIEAENPKLKNILDKRFARVQLPDGKLGELVDLISTIGFGEDIGKARDLLGQVYEYFLGQFASAEGRRGGQFYTPASIVKTLVAVLNPHHGKVYALCCTLDEAKAVREEVAFLQAIKVLLTKREISAKKKTDEERELAIRQIIGNAVVSGDVVDVFAAVGLDKPNIGLLDDEFLAEVRNLPEKNLAVELLERLLEGEIKSKFASNLAQEKKFSELLDSVIKRYQNRSIETAQVIEELIEMAKKFAAASKRGDQLGLNDDELAFYDALANNESSVRELGDETLAKIAHELTQSLRQNVTVDWSNRDSVRAKLRLLVKRILRKYKYPPDQQEEAAQLVLAQAETLCEAWM